jgi:hypothetical protein
MIILWHIAQKAWGTIVFLAGLKQSIRLKGRIEASLIMDFGERGETP